MTHPRKEASFISVATAFGLITTAIGGGMYVGALASDVDTLKEEKQKVEQIEDEVKQNTETLIGVVVTQGYIITAQNKQDLKLDRIIQKLEEMD